MRPLRDDEPKSEESGDELAKLLRRAPARSPSNERRQAILSASDSKGARAVPRARLRLVFATVGIIASVGFASAMIGRYLHSPKTVAPAAKVTTPAPSAPAPKLSDNEVAAHAGAMVEAEAESPVEAKQSTGVAPTIRPKIHASKPTAKAKAINPEEMAGVLAAMKALRHDHDPVRSNALLAEYLRRYPKGALLEEALSLQIETAVVKHDERALILAKRYLDRYPHGRFRETARQAQQQFSH